MSSSDVEISRLKRAKEIAQYFNDNGLKQTCTRFGLKKSTVKRNLRRARKYNIVETVIEHKVPRVLLFDLETSPMDIKLRTWSLGKHYIKHKHIDKPSALLSYAGKWLCDSSVEGASVTPKEAQEREDKSIIKDLWELLDEADVIIGHYVKGFDRKVANTRFLMNGLTPPSPYKMIDTYKDVKKNFRFPSSSLAYLSKVLADHEKHKTTKSLWDRCVEGEEPALSDMLNYNKQDVRALEDVYLTIRGWGGSGVNLALYFEGDIENRCPNCGMDKLKDNGFYYTAVNKYRALRCKNCGNPGRERHSCLTEEDKAKLVRPISNV